MTDNQNQHITTLEQFKGLLITYSRTHDQQVRSAILKKTAIVQRIVTIARASKTITIAPPPAVGGMIMRDINPFDVMFNDYYGLDIVGTVIDCIDEAIGHIESNEGFSIEPKPNLAHQEQIGNKMTKQITTKEQVRILGMSQEAFWPLLAAVIGGVFYLGLRLGQARFDSEKNDLYNSNQSYKAENYHLLKQLGVEQSHERELTDSLNEAHSQSKILHHLK